MKTLQLYINEQISYNLIKLSEEQKLKLLEYDNLYGILVKEFKNYTNKNSIVNFKEETNKMVKSIQSSKYDYYPVFKYCDNSKITNKKYVSNLIDSFNELKDKFKLFKCYISKFYIEKIDAFTNMLNHYYNNGEYFDDLITYDDYLSALEYIKSNKYYSNEELDEKKFDANYCKIQLENELKKLNIDNVTIDFNDNMVPRVSVSSKQVLINSNAKFSESDIISLKAHEIDTHVIKNINSQKYGYGLNLFKFGLFGYKKLNEGHAIYNALQALKNIKNNILYNVAIRTIIAYDLIINKYDIYMVYKDIHNLCPDIEQHTICSAILREKRGFPNTKILGAFNDDYSYFSGYNIINKLNNSDRNLLIKYNIGINQLYELDTIRQFLDINFKN